MQPVFHAVSMQIRNESLELCAQYPPARSSQVSLNNTIIVQGEDHGLSLSSQLQELGITTVRSKSKDKDLEAA